MRNCSIKLVLLFSLLSCALGLRAETLRVVAEPWPPYVDDHLPQNGLAMDLVNTAFMRARYDIKLSFQTLSKVLDGTRQGTYDVAANLWRNEERSAYVDFSEPYLINDIRFIKRKGSPVNFEHIEDLDGLKIGVVRDYAYPKRFATASNFAKINHSGLLPAIRELAKGRYDLVIGDINAINYVLLKYLPKEAKSLEILPKPVGLQKLRIGVSKANPKHGKIVKSFNRAMRSMQKDGTYQTLIATHQQQHL